MPTVDRYINRNDLGARVSVDGRESMWFREKQEGAAEYSFTVSRVSDVAIIISPWKHLFVFVFFFFWNLNN